MELKSLPAEPPSSTLLETLDGASFPVIGIPGISNYTSLEPLRPVPAAKPPDSPRRSAVAANNDNDSLPNGWKRSSSAQSLAQNDLLPPYGLSQSTPASPDFNTGGFLPQKLRSASGFFRRSPAKPRDRSASATTRTAQSNRLSQGRAVFEHFGSNFPHRSASSSPSSLSSSPATSTSNPSGSGNTSTSTPALPERSAGINGSSTTSVASIRNSATPESHPDVARALREIKQLEHSVQKFTAKTGLSRTNLLRKTLLSFLRADRGYIPQGTPISSAKAAALWERKISTFVNWWDALLTILHASAPPLAISGNERSAYLEAVSGLLSRDEWYAAWPSAEQPAIVAAHGAYQTFQRLVSRTLAYVLPRLERQKVPLQIRAFGGKILAYAFFHVPGVAHVLLYSLHVPWELANRTIEASFDLQSGNGRFIETPAFTQARSCIPQVRAQYPLHIAYFTAFPLVYYAANRRKPRSQRPVGRNNVLLPPEGKVADIDLRFLLDTSPRSHWRDVWARPDSAVFYAFLTHYYGIIAKRSTLESPDTVNSLVEGKESSKFDSHVLAPGLLILHSHILRIFDRMSRANWNPVGPPARMVPSEFRPDAALVPKSASHQYRRQQQLRSHGLFAALREILFRVAGQPLKENLLKPPVPAVSTPDTPALAWTAQFERLLLGSGRAIAARDTDAAALYICVVEETLLSFMLPVPLRASGSAGGPTAWGSTMTVALVNDFPESINVAWHEWVAVCEKLLSIESFQLECHVLAFLYNMWEYLPLSDFAMARVPAGEDPSEPPGDEYAVRWRLAVWLLSPEMWRKFFAHWQPAVQAYYVRLVCWKLASVGSGAELEALGDPLRDSGLVVSPTYGAYNEAVRRIVAQRLQETREWLVSHLLNENNSKVSVAPRTRRLVVADAERDQLGSHSGTSAGMECPTRVYAFDVFDDDVYMKTAALPTGAFGSSLSSLEIPNGTRDPPPTQPREKGSRNFVSSISMMFGRKLNFGKSQTESEKLGGNRNWDNTLAEEADFSFEAAEPRLSIPTAIRCRVPEISRPRTRFSFVWAKGRPPTKLNDLLRLRLPFHDGLTAVWELSEQPITNNRAEFHARQATYVVNGLAEWCDAVPEFEQFVRSRRINQGSTRLEDIILPRMVPEYPGKLIGG